MRRVLDLPEYVVNALSLLKLSGYEAYLVGGSVRDAYMGIKPFDYDITTNAKPNEVVQIFSKDRKVIETGIKHGTVTVMIDGFPIEITTYRIDGEYINSRKPESVIFTPNLVDDLKRRDFTINALVYDGNGEILDHFNGIDDIDSKIIRCIGVPDERFSEDALRILRALRFSAKLDFGIDTETSLAINKTSHLLKKISSERIFSELSMLFSYKNRARIKSILTEYKSVIETAIDFKISNIDYNSVCQKSSLINLQNDLALSYYLSAICGDEQQLQNVLKHLKVSNAFEKQTVQLLDIQKNIDKFYDLISVKLLAKKYGIDFCVVAGNVFNETRENTVLKTFADKICSENMCVSLAGLDVSGKDILNEIPDIDHKKIGDILDRLLVLVIDEKTENKKRILLNEAHNILKTL